MTVESHVVEEFKEDSEFMSIYPQLKTWSIGQCISLYVLEVHVHEIGPLVIFSSRCVTVT